MGTHILIIDDDKKLIDLLRDYLAGFGYKVSAATHPRDGLLQLRRQPPDLVILDVMLPEMDGFAVCREIRRESAVPIIMLTARGELTDRVVGLEMGADDYLPKPFEPRELVARMQSILRRTRETGGGEVRRFGDLEVHVHLHTAKRNGEDLLLTAAEFEVLTLFIRNPGRVLDRDYILEHIRGIEWEAFDRSIDVTISRLRRKLGDDAKQPRWLRTVRGVGYVFIGQENSHA